jgi:uncharacterized membrane protein
MRRNGSLTEPVAHWPVECSPFAGRRAHAAGAPATPSNPRKQGIRRMGHAIAVALFLHLLGVAIWIGGMIFAHFCLRPGLEDLSPQLRLPVWEAVFGRFFNWVGVSVIVILLSGGYLMMQFGGGNAAWPVRAMAGTGVLMMLIFGHIRFALFPRVIRALQAQRWPDGARAVGTVRRLVLLNIVLGIVTIGFAVLARGF